MSISDTDTITGFQDAITPPKSSNLTLLTWISIVVVLGYAVYQFGWGTGGITFAVFFVVSVVAGAIFIPKPESTHYLKRIYCSMVNCHADFQKSGDSSRADAIKLLIEKIEVQYEEKLK